MDSLVCLGKAGRVFRTANLRWVIKKHRKCACPNPQGARALGATMMNKSITERGERYSVLGTDGGERKAEWVLDSRSLHWHLNPC